MMTDAPGEPAAIMISYGPNAVLGKSEPIYEALRRRFGPRVLRNTDYFKEHADVHLRSCRILVPIVEPPKDGAAGRLKDPEDTLVHELQVAAENKIKVVPVLVDHAPSLPGGKGVNINDPHYERGIRDLVRRLEKILDPRPPQPLLRTLTDPSALLLAVTFAVLNYLLGAAPWIAFGIGVGVLVAWMAVDAVWRSQVRS
jgi:hypothetical protein